MKIQFLGFIPLLVLFTWVILENRKVNPNLIALVIYILGSAMALLFFLLFVVGGGVMWGLGLLETTL